MDIPKQSQFSHRPKLDNIYNNACEVFNARIKEVRSKPIITLLEDLNNHVGKLPLVIQSRLEKVHKESKNWVLIWTGDEEYEKFEVHGHPTNMVVDLGKRLCTCQFWMLTYIPCVYVCAVLARVNKRSEDFCHPLKKSVYNQTQAPNIKHKLRKLTTKRQKDADEGTSGNKKPKATVTLKRQLKLATPREDVKKRADELATALAAAAAAVAVAKSKTTSTRSTPAAEATNPTNVAPQVDEAPSSVAVQNHAQVEITDNLPLPSVATEIDLSQPNYGGTQDEAPPRPPPTKGPDKLPTKRRNSPPLVTASVDPMQGASATTSFRLADFLKFVPTPEFKPPKKRNTKSST
ncbi:hypothetical protein Ahy_A04g018062 [Arachis hypogaea]|uniref:SWIM-type domain-containing protein n=1 Tax=Arachis hypogaea TaxID=3818 RepID=A0A445DCR3_ARAHY|nr:hypothetical protein Ahy_A04g018062 [Arachis hypogaea]